jgi:hypothetical protein
VGCPYPLRIETASSAAAAFAPMTSAFWKNEVPVTAVALALAELEVELTLLLAMVLLELDELVTTLVVVLVPVELVMRVEVVDFELVLVVTLTLEVDVVLEELELVVCSVELVVVCFVVLGRRNCGTPAARERKRAITNKRVNQRPRTMMCW